MDPTTLKATMTFTHLSESTLKELDTVSYADLLSVTEAAACIDLRHSHNYAMEEIGHLLQENPKEAIYFSGDVSPILNFDEQEYYSDTLMKRELEAWLEKKKDLKLTAASFSNPASKQQRPRFSTAGFNLSHVTPDITCYEDILKFKGTIYDATCKPIVTLKDRTIEQLSRQSPYSQAYVDLIVKQLYDWMQAKCKIIPLGGNLHSLVKEEDAFFLYDDTLVGKAVQVDGEVEYQETPDQLKVAQVVDTVLGELFNFVRSRPHNCYHVWLRGFALVLECGVDARVVDYHRLIHNHMQEMKDEAETQCHRGV